MSDNTLETTLMELSRARKEKDLLDREYKRIKEAWEAGQVDLINTIRAREKRVDDLEASVRALALARYSDDGNKHPCEGVNIKLVTTLAPYNEDQAFTWCKEKQMALKFDRVAFEKIAKANSNSMPYWCKLFQEPKAMIGKDI